MPNSVLIFHTCCACNWNLQSDEISMWQDINLATSNINYSVYFLYFTRKKMFTSYETPLFVRVHLESADYVMAEAPLMMTWLNWEKL